MPDPSDARSRSSARLGQLIRANRRRLGLTQQRLAADFGVDQSTIARWELGDRVSPDRLADIADWLGLPVHEVVEINYSDAFGVQSEVAVGRTEDPLVTTTYGDLEDAVDALFAASTLGLGARLHNLLLEVADDEFHEIWILEILADTPEERLGEDQ